MSLARKVCQPPGSPLNLLEDHERKLEGPVWDLKGVQAVIRERHFSFRVTPSSHKTILHELDWGSEHLRHFVLALSPGRHLASEWCYATQQFPYPADAYFMGFNKIKGEENQKTEPWCYFKFTVLEEKKHVLILSAHPKRENGKS